MQRSGFLVFTFLKLIVLASYGSRFFFFFYWIVWSSECMSQKYRYAEGGIRGAQPSDRELWRSSLISELPRWDKGPLKSQETEQSKRRRTFQEKQHATETQHDPGRRHCAWTSDESSHWAFAVNYWSSVTPNREAMSEILNYRKTLIRPALIAVGRARMIWN